MSERKSEAGGGDFAAASPQAAGGSAADRENILVVFTGGTIGSRKQGRIIDVETEGGEAAEAGEGAGFALLEMYAELAETRGTAAVGFETVQPYRILSENITPSHWRTLLDCLAEAEPGRYRGVIVTHGSDTLPYTAAALALAWPDIPVPLALVASNYPLADPRSNGLRNFAAAVDFIADAALPGVFVLFGDGTDECPVYLGTRLFEALPFTDRFAAPYGAPIGCMRGGLFEPHPHPVNPSVEELRRPREAAVSRARIRYATDVLYVKPYPGLDYGLYDFGVRRPAAVLHGVYHSATASGAEAEGYRASLASFAARCAEQGVDVYVAPAKDADADLYRSADEMLRAGVVPLPQMTVETALVKLMMAYGTFATREERRLFLMQSVYYERHEGGNW